MSPENAAFKRISLLGYTQKNRRFGIAHEWNAIPATFWNMFTCFSYVNISHVLVLNLWSYSSERPWWKIRFTTNHLHTSFAFEYPLFSKSTLLETMATKTFQWLTLKRLFKNKAVVFCIGPRCAYVTVQLFLRSTMACVIVYFKVFGWAQDDPTTLKTSPQCKYTWNIQIMSKGNERWEKLRWRCLFKNANLAMTCLYYFTIFE